MAHSLRVKGFAATSVVAELTGLDERTVTGVLEDLRDAGHARVREGRWSLTPDGRVHHATSCAVDLVTSGRYDRVREGYGGFVALNGTFLQVCADWQVKGGSPQLNDHTDAAYELGVVERLTAIDDRVQPVVDDLGGRFAGYGPRLTGARARVESGERDWFTGAMIDSYHTVWFELHEDLLATLGLERAKEAS